MTFIVLFLRYLMWLAVANLLVCVVLLPFTLHSHATPVPYAAALYFAHIEVSLRKVCPSSLLRQTEAIDSCGIEYERS